MALLSAVVLAAPPRAMAAEAADGALPVQQAQAATPPAPGQPMMGQEMPGQPSAMPPQAGRHARPSPTERVEARIADLHARLRITPQQETRWSAVAQAMRDNAKSIEEAIRERRKTVRTMTAIDDLRSYEHLAEVHADGLKKLVTVFAPLYEMMPEDQKKTADTVFRYQERHPPRQR